MTKEHNLLRNAPASGTKPGTSHGVWRERDRVAPSLRKGQEGTGEVSRVRTVLDIQLRVESGLLSGLVAKSEMRELLDELYGSFD